MIEGICKWLVDNTEHSVLTTEQTQYIPPPIHDGDKGNQV